MRYVVMRAERGKLIPKMQTDYEDKNIFIMAANAVGYDYRILKNGIDITDKYKKKAKCV